MKVTTRILAALTLLLSAAVLLKSLAVGVGIWVVKGPVTARATHVFERVDAALNMAQENLDQVKVSLERARERLASALEEQRRLAREPQQTGAVRRLLARTVRQTIAPELGDANEKLHAVAEAAVVVNAVLEDVGNIPLLSVAGLDLDRLTEMNDRLAGVGPAAWELSRLLGEPESDPEAGPQFTRIEQTVQTLQRLLAEYEPQVTEVRRRTEQLKADTLPWITHASILISALCFWIALSQVSLMIHARSWWKRSGVHNP